MSKPLTTEGEPRNTTNAIENLRWRLEKGGLYLTRHVRETLLGDVADIERAATLDAARALTELRDRVEQAEATMRVLDRFAAVRCNCGHSADFHSDLGQCHHVTYPYRGCVCRMTARAVRALRAATPPVEPEEWQPIDPAEDTYDKAEPR